MEKLQSEFKRRSTAEELVQTIHEIRTGGRVDSVALKDAGARWKALPFAPASAAAGSHVLEVRLPDGTSVSGSSVAEVAALVRGLRG